MLISTFWQMEEREAQIKELQNTITELHQEMSLKDQEKLQQLKQLVHLEARIKTLTQEVSSDQMAERGLEVLKSELDIQEQRLWELQRELQEKQQELRRGHNRLQQLSIELKSSTRNAQELQGQLLEARARVVQVETENEALLEYKRLHKSEVEKLSAELSSIQRGSEEEQETERKFRELQAELSATQARLSDCQHGTQEAQKRADQQIQQLQEEVSRLKLQHQSVNQQVGLLHQTRLLHLSRPPPFVSFRFTSLVTSPSQQCSFRELGVFSDMIENSPVQIHSNKPDYIVAYT
ncbi:hypothetical protein C0J50_6644 [Silurus asotus]|uniref:Uncharacterized protein n=1 Tax=Silurus asotus TaxID=30991 RepID=A0AAD5A387_SILAS|nr:hypothetical protein C0J50_6644 [Silurus asotus]